VVIHLHAYTYKVLQNFRWAYELSAVFYVAVRILDYTRIVALCLVKTLERSGCGEIVQKDFSRRKCGLMYVNNSVRVASVMGKIRIRHLLCTIPHCQPTPTCSVISCSSKIRFIFKERDALNVLLYKTVRSQKRLMLRIALLIPIPKVSTPNFGLENG